MRERRCQEIGSYSWFVTWSIRKRTLKAIRVQKVLCFIREFDILEIYYFILEVWRDLLLFLCFYFLYYDLTWVYCMRMMIQILGKMHPLLISNLERIACLMLNHNKIIILLLLNHKTVMTRPLIMESELIMSSDLMMLISVMEMWTWIQFPWLWGIWSIFFSELLEQLQ